jgi:hypothetical protein
MLLELFVDNDLVRRYEEENEHLKIKLEAAERTQIININDPNFKGLEPTKEDLEQVSNIYADYFKPF